MKKLKKITLLFLSLVATCLLAVATGCKEESTGIDSSTPTENGSSSGGSQDSSTDDEDSELWNRWVRVTPPTCTEDGLKKRTLKADSTVVEQKNIPARGHEYADTNDGDTPQGHCIRCDQAAIIPTVAPEQVFTNVEITCTHNQIEIDNNTCDCTYPGHGTQSVHLILDKGYYTITIPSNGNLWISATPEEVGQYVFYSLNSPSATVTRYPSSGGGTLGAAIEGIAENNNFFSYINHIPPNPAVFCIEGRADTTLKIALVKVAEKPWVQGSELIKVEATEIKGKKAEDGPEGKELQDVPYSAQYFYDDPAQGGDGYYHLGSKEYKGEIIYVKINQSPERLFSDGSSFSTLDSSALTLSYGTNADGDICSYNYVPFMLNWKNEDSAVSNRPGAGSSGSDSGTPEVDLQKNCYQNYCNKDGAYPVNKELYRFLNLYVRRNAPMDETLNDDDDYSYFAETQKDIDDPSNWLWLSACYYYKEYEMGTQRHPLVMQTGETEIRTKSWDFYYGITKSDAFYTITWSTPNVYISVGEHPEPFDGSVTLAPNTLFTVYGWDGTDSLELTTILTVTKAATGGSTEDAIPIQNTGALSLSTLPAYDASGTEVHYAYYTYTASQSGTLKLTITGSVPDKTIIKLGDISVTENTAELSVEKGDLVTVYISGETETSLSANLHFVEAV